MSKRTQRSAGHGSSGQKRDGAARSRSTSTPSDMPSSGSKRRYRQPATAVEFASQVNDVCTRLLNGDIDLNRAKAYASLARVVSQTVSAEVTRARFLKEAPNLSLRLTDIADDLEPR